MKVYLLILAGTVFWLICSFIVVSVVNDEPKRGFIARHQSGRFLLFAGGPLTIAITGVVVAIFLAAMMLAEAVVNALNFLSED